MENNDEARVKLTNTQLNKLNSATNKNVQDEGLSHELFLTTTQKIKLEMPSLTICQQM